MIRIKRFLFPLLIILLSAIIIFYRFPDLPKYLAFDEVEFAKLALSLNGKLYASYSSLATGHATFYFYVILLAFKLIGISQFALRLPSALSAIFSAVLFYVIIRRLTKHSFVSFLSTCVLVTSRWFFGFARFSFEPTFLLFFELTSLYFLLRFTLPAGKQFDKSKQSLWPLFFSGIFAGLAYNSYTPGRIFFLLPFFSLILFLYRKKRSRFITLKTCLYFLIPFIILIIPLQTYLLTHQDIRIYQLSFLQNNKLTVPQKITFLADNVSSTISMFVVKGDPNGKHNYPYKPALNPILGLLAIAGLVIVIKNFKKKENILFLGYFILSLFPTILVYPWENPSMLRTYTSLPSIAFFAALPFTVILNQKKFFKKKIFTFALIILIIVSSLYELRTYFIYQAKVFQHSFEVKQDLITAIHCPNVLKCNK